MVRKPNLDWTDEAKHFADYKLIPMLKQSLDEALNNGFTTEDWFYLVSHSADDVILDKHFEMKY